MNPEKKSKPDLEHIEECIVCNNPKSSFLFAKKSDQGEEFKLCKCSNCHLEYVSPRPTYEAIGEYYKSQYFSQRTDRGYNNYFSKKIKSEIERVIRLNLGDLDFFKYESNIQTKYSLDIGCAAGYFVNYLYNRNWQAEGIDVSKSCTDFAQNSLRLKVQNGNYLETTFTKKFNLITLWATIEHLHYPVQTIKKIYSDLAPGGYIYISTCRIDGINFMKLFGKKWRYYNFPEHLFFFSKKTITNFLKQHGFVIKKYFTYGSGTGKANSILRKIADFFAKYYKMGDMMVIAAQKPSKDK
jgi:2-polyprenyl-3-methyl-5-hydroxy-6-metoxy-1,4-benzoquinol methylase